MKELKPWPVLAEYSEQTPYGLCMTPVQGWDYEKARLDAAMERLRMAVEALTLAYVALGLCDEERHEQAQDVVQDVLDDIGDLPT